MPGTPDPVLGSGPVTDAVALAAGGVVALAPLVVRRRPELAGRRVLAGATAYATAIIATWALVRLGSPFLDRLLGNPGTAVAWIGLCWVVVYLQASLPLYLHLRHDFVAPLVGLAGATALVLATFLRVGGETDPIGLYAILFGPLAIAGTLVLAGLEALVRYGPDAVGRLG